MSDTSTQANLQDKKGILKKRVVRFVLIMLGVVLVLAGLAVGGSFIVPKSITGTWELVENPEVVTATSDEASEDYKAYYVFEKPDRYGRGDYHTCYQGGVEYFEYELLEENSVKKINLGTKDMEYKISGSKLFGKAKLTIIFPEYTDETTGASYEAQEYVFEQAKNPEYEKQSYKDYEIDSKLTEEKWASNERSLAYYFYRLPYTQTIEFTDKGVMIIHYESAELGLDRYMYYVYSAKDNELTFSLVTDKETNYKVTYEFDEKGNLKFKDDITADSIFADAFFGDFTFYTQENLPEPTNSVNDETYFSE